MQLIIKSNQSIMEDSLELPDDTECLNLQNLLSPEPLLKDSRENTPPHSLAYSNSTCVKDKLGDIQMRSPIAFEPNTNLGEYSPTRTGYIKVNNQNHPINNYQRTVSNSPQKIEEQRITTDRVRIKGGKPQIRLGNNADKKINLNQRIVINKSSSIIAKSQVQHQIRKHPEVREPEIHAQQPRRTIAKNQASKLASRIKQLQQALHLETVISEELRTKLSVTNKLLQSKLKENGLEFFLNLKNSSRDLRNIDIFIELTNLQKALTQKMIIIDRQKGQLKEANLEVQRLKQKKQLQKSPTRRFNEQIQKLLEQKQSLICYIDEQKATLKRKIDYIAELESQINRMGDKESHYTDMERPKFIAQLSEMKEQNRKLSEQLDTIRMEMNLMQITYKEEIQGLKIKNQKYDWAIIHQEKQLQHLKQEQQLNIKQYKSMSSQKTDDQREIMIKELDLLKQQRDYYLVQYRKRTSQSAKLYALQLKLASYQKSREGI